MADGVGGRVGDLGEAPSASMVKVRIPTADAADAPWSVQ
jgi:hypothetical protein